MYPGERSMRSSPSRKCLPERKIFRVQLDRRRQALWSLSGERSTARQCRGYGPCPSRTAAGDTNTYRPKPAAVSLYIGKQIPPENVPRDHAQHTNKCLPQRKELRVQLDRPRQAFWAVSGERSTARQSRGYGPCPSRTAAGGTNTDSKLQQ